jgi:hypothetical protein
MISEGKRAIVRGKDIGASIIDIIEKIADTKHSRDFRVHDIPEGLSNYRRIQLTALQAKEDNELAIESLYDRCDTVEALYSAYLAECEEADTKATMTGLKDFITGKFEDTTSDDTLVFSTVHKAKGLEFDTVFILKSELMPHPAAKKDWQIDQEYNIIYVALTRAKKRLFFLDRAIPQFVLPDVEPTTLLTDEQIHERLLSIAEPLREGDTVLLDSGETITLDKQPWEIAVCPDEEKPAVAKRSRGRPRKNAEAIRDRVNVSLDVDVIRFLRTKSNYSELVENLIQALPEFDEFIKQ